ncbi:MAG: ATP-binding protein [Candidatus Kapabacteria bacterium]|jgi:two-component system sensor histidine kinase/response regulator|nr:ATP-binding protein [Candidatus Kapabacteria bacterium]
MSGILSGKLIKEFLKIFFPVTIIVVVIFVIFTGTLKNEYIDRISIDEYHRVNNGKNDFEKSLLYRFTDAIIISELILGHSDDLSSGEPNLKMAKELQVFTDKKDVYDQVRFIDINGNEIVRVNGGNGVSRIVPNNELQNKGNRYYFENGIKLNNKLYISPFDLNIEYKKIEIPIKPMIRITYPVITKDSKKIGLVVLNFLAGNLLNKLERQSEASLGNIYLVNSAGYWIKGPSRDVEWGFMFNKQTERISKDFPEEWNTISSEKFGQFETDNGLFTFSTILDKNNLPLVDGNENKIEIEESYKIISFIEESSLIPPWSQVTNFSLVLFLCLTTILIWYLSKMRLGNKENTVRISNLIAELEGRVLERTYELNIALGKAEEASELKTNILANISHEFRTPLNVINGNTQLVKMKNNDSHILKMIGNVENSVLQLSNMIDNILDYSLADQKSLILEDIDFYLADLFNSLKNTYQKDTAKKGLELRFENDDSIPQVLIGDSKQLLHALALLVDNAIKFTETGFIAVSANMLSKKEDTCRIIFAVKDSGIGIPNDRISEAFNTFTQLDGNSTRKHGGIGLGLSLCNKIIKLMGGEIFIESELNEGSTFSFVLDFKKSDKSYVPLKPENISEELVSGQMSEEHEVTENETAVEIDHDKLNSLVKELIELLEDDDYDAIAKIDEILEPKWAGKNKETLLEILSKVQEYDFEEALRLVHEFKGQF